MSSPKKMAFYNLYFGNNFQFSVYLLHYYKPIISFVMLYLKGGLHLLYNKTTENI
jgi:hypothetical protein